MSFTSGAPRLSQIGWRGRWVVPAAQTDRPGRRRSPWRLPRLSCSPRAADPRGVGRGTSLREHPPLSPPGCRPAPLHRAARRACEASASCVRRVSPARRRPRLPPAGRRALAAPRAAAPREPPATSAITVASASRPTAASPSAAPAPATRSPSSPAASESRPAPPLASASTIDAPADVAQLVEHFTRNEGVPGSSPGVGSFRMWPLARLGGRVRRAYRRSRRPRGRRSRRQPRRWC